MENNKSMPVKVYLNGNIPPDFRFIGASRERNGQHTVEYVRVMSTERLQLKRSEIIAISKALPIAAERLSGKNKRKISAAHKKIAEYLKEKEK